MLILNRRVGETTVIGDREINVIVLAANRSRDSLGIEAGPDDPMSIINLRDGETTVIGDREITIIVLNTRRGRARLGIEADQDIPIFREELLAKPEQENDYVH